MLLPLVSVATAFLPVASKAQSRQTDLEPAVYNSGSTRAWGNTDYHCAPWTRNISRAMIPSRGLEGRHIVIWPSHGRYYDSGRNRWMWQRPNLFLTNEDLFTQTIVIPFLIPMLENSGAVVFTPRERDWQTNEIIVDNDNDLYAAAQPIDSSKVSMRLALTVSDGYREHGSWQRCLSPGFKAPLYALSDGINPFEAGTVRQTAATSAPVNVVSYEPQITEDGRYAVYVSYATVHGSVDDAHYTVIHKGTATHLRVNQRIGGSTWVYLGTYDFDSGKPSQNCVVLTSESACRGGVVTADAVRFGGGMGVVERGGKLSGLPKSLEGARYWAQWAGMPYSVYGGRNGRDDYSDDINSRSLMANYIGGGSCFMPLTNGLGVPFELALAVHSDAGYECDGKSLVGSLAISTSNIDDEELASGVSRFSSGDFAKALLDNLKTDISRRFGKWNVRYLWDRNYSETRLPDIPSSIIETLSHQNFPDMRMGQDPVFRFWLARSVYKTILRYVTSNHGLPCTVQPLPPKMVSAVVGSDEVVVTWEPRYDSDEPSARPTAYILYTSRDSLGFDNGRRITGTSCAVPVEQGHQYSFRVTSANDGGESLPSEMLTAYYGGSGVRSLLIVNNFTRLASPQVIDTDSTQGFDLDSDEGVSYGLTAGWNGRQTAFDRSRMGRETADGLGFGGGELAGHFVMGNTFDYPAEHARAIASTGSYNISSCMMQAVENGRVQIGAYPIVDIIEGQQRDDGYTPRKYPAFPQRFRRQMKDYLDKGGNLLVSGCYIGRDMQSAADSAFLSNVMHVDFKNYVRSDSDSIVRGGSAYGMGLEVDFYNELNARHYACIHPEELAPVAGGDTLLRYADGGCAAAGFRRQCGRIAVMGFPLECVTGSRMMNRLAAALLSYLVADDKKITYNNN